MRRINHKELKRKFILCSNDYQNKPMPNEMIETIQSYQKKLQREENIKFGRKACSVSFVYAAKVFNNLMRDKLEEVSQ